MHQLLAVFALLPSIISCTVKERQETYTEPPPVMNADVYLSYQPMLEGYIHDYIYYDSTGKPALQFTVDFNGMYTDSIYHFSDTFIGRYYNIYKEKEVLEPTDYGREVFLSTTLYTPASCYSLHAFKSWYNKNLTLFIAVDSMKFENEIYRHQRFRCTIGPPEDTVPPRHWWKKYEPAAYWIDYFYETP